MWERRLPGAPPSGGAGGGEQAAQQDKPNKLLDKLKENSFWLVLAAVLGMVLARWGL